MFSPTRSLGRSTMGGTGTWRTTITTVSWKTWRSCMIWVSSVNSYILSISWARLLPRGRLGGVNSAAIAFYDRLIAALLEKGIEPFVTLHHFDLPHELETRYGGWLGAGMREEFDYYADV
ncbi:unnamed protein product [Triticum turgidum subsp. durum]|uniref:4-hydroxy-7-methoxy-3-oxo-3,4-dihydro-2H-1,4-benzoxazin-2-yl glucosidebeta-D-glucosidase n=1 Tax=Triticum turgidum subsp. durum TaxID=4567 RepID=A0A9R1P0K1_TRITD|nr:unnamed protein product [Triticum turgidum subsp. durum]